jgi:hypothetical protein
MRHVGVRGYVENVGQEDEEQPIKEPKEFSKFDLSKLHFRGNYGDSDDRDLRK